MTASVAVPADAAAVGGIPAHWDDLAGFVRFLEKQGELRRITREVDPNLEVSAIAQQLVRAGGPALLFERVAGSRYPLLINTYATRRRVSWASVASRCALPSPTKRSPQYFGRRPWRPVSAPAVICIHAPRSTRRMKRS